MKKVLVGASLLLLLFSSCGFSTVSIEYDIPKSLLKKTNQMTKFEVKKGSSFNEEDFLTINDIDERHHQNFLGWYDVKTGKEITNNHTFNIDTIIEPKFRKKDYSENNEADLKDNTQKTSKSNVQDDNNKSNELGIFRIPEFRYKNHAGPLTYDFFKVEVVDNIDEFYPERGKFLIIHTEITPDPEIKNFVRKSNFLVTMPSMLKGRKVFRDIESRRIYQIESENYSSSIRDDSGLDVATYLNQQLNYISKNNDGVKEGYDKNFIGVSDSNKKRALIFDLTEEMIHDKDTYLEINSKEYWGDDDEYLPYRLYINTKKFVQEKE